MFAKPPFGKQDEQRIVEAIAAAERNTSGEIRLHVEARCKSDVMKRAVEVFNQLGMANTQVRNGVLIYVALADHAFAIIGDTGINEKVPPGFWDETKNLMLGHFKQGNIVDGIIEGITDAGAQLKVLFPHLAGDHNELTNDISYGKGEK